MGVQGLWALLERGAAAGNGAADEAATDDSSTSTVISMRLAAREAARAAAEAASPSSSSSSAASFTPRVLAVDLSVWLMESRSLARSFAMASSSDYSGPPKKHHLTYLFSRACAFLMQGVRLVFVTDGRPPEHKARLGHKDNQLSVAANRRGGAVALAAQLRECKQLLQLLDLPLLELAAGEAEACCAALNASGVVDGVLTTDGDALLFGARTLLRDLQASQTALSARLVSMPRIEAEMQLDRAKLILLALMLGSDYTSGVRGLGPRKAIKLLRVMERCEPAYAIVDPPNQSASPQRAGDSSLLTRMFRTLMSLQSAEEAIDRLTQWHGGRSSPSNHSQPSSATSSVSDAASSPAIDYSALSVTQLKELMAKHGLKPQTKAAMIAKLQQIESISPASAAAATAALLPIADADAVLISDSDSEAEAEEDLTASSGRNKQKKGGQSSSRSTSRSTLRSFLTRSFTLVYDRYGSADSARHAEVERVLAAYWTPTIRPSIGTLQKQIKASVPFPPDFLQLRSFLASATLMPFVKFERQWLPVELHTQLWRMEAQDGDKTCVQSRDSASTRLAADSTVAAAAALSPTASSPSSSPSQPLFTPSHIAKRRVIQGAAYFTLIWEKTERGRREMATLPKCASVASDASDADANASPPEEEIDMTLSQSPPPPPGDCSPVASPPSSSPSAPSTSSATGAATAKLVQDVDVRFWETNEPVSFLARLLPHLVQQFEDKEREERERKEQARAEKADKAAADKARKKSKSTLENGEQAANLKGSKRGRKQASVTDTPPITAFLSPIPSPLLAVSPPPTAAGLDEKQRVEPRIHSPPVASEHVKKQPQQSSMRSGVIQFVSRKYDVPARSPPIAPSIFALSTQRSEWSVVKSASSVASRSIKQSSLQTFVTSNRTVLEKKEESDQKRCDAVAGAADQKEKEEEYVFQSPVLVSGSPPPTSSSSSLSASLSASLSLCPLCSRAFPMHLLPDHANSCLDQQQLLADEQMARELGASSQPSPPPSTTPARPVAVDSSSVADSFALDDSSLDDVELMLVPDESMPQHVSRSSPSRRSRSRPLSSHASPLTPQKRKKRRSPQPLSSDSDLDNNSEHELRPSALTAASSSSVSLAASTFAPPPPLRPSSLLASSACTVLDLVDSSEEEDDEPGSTIYSRNNDQNHVAAAPQLKSIFAP